jgi:hypothetical protein
MRRPKRGDNPVAAILLGKALLEDFLDEGKFVEKMFAMRWRVIREFVNARPSDRHRSREARDRSTVGYIAIVDEHLTSLATHLMRKMGPWVLDKVYSVDDLPRSYHAESRRDREIVARFVCFELIMRQLILLREENELWYQEGWVVPQSVMDEYLRLVRGSRQSYCDQRSFHGRPNRDRYDGTLPGTSVGASR